MPDCTKCNKNMKSSKTLSFHLKKCNGLKSTQCELCHKNFSNAVAKSRHKKNEICRKNGTMIVTTNVTTNNGVINNIQTLNLNITLLPFSKSTYEHLLENPKKSSEYVLNELQSILNFIKDSHFNEKHPELHNIKKEHKRGDIVLIQDNENKWKPVTAMEATKTLLQRYSNFSDEIVEEALETMSNGSRNEYIKQLQFILELLKKFDIAVDENLERTNTFKINQNKIIKDISDAIYYLSSS
jgi:hypothetical protein